MPGSIAPDDKTLLTGLYETAVRAADPVKALRPHLPEKPKGRVVVIGAGKGAAQLAAAFETLWDAPLRGVVVTRYGYACPTRVIRVMEASHPVPDAAGLAASAALFDAVRGLAPDDLVVAMICGGGSALLPCPPGDLTLADEAALNRALLASGAPISVMNAIRKQVSGIKGGRLAAACHPARVVSLVVSDVPGDDPAQVASGPTVPDATTRAEARTLVATWRIDLPPRVAEWLAGDQGLAPLPACRWRPLRHKPKPRESPLSSSLTPSKARRVILAVCTPPSPARSPAATAPSVVPSSFCQVERPP
jgi:hydroxypyruvate reductase